MAVYSKISYKKLRFPNSVNDLRPIAEPTENQQSCPYGVTRSSACLRPEMSFDPKRNGFHNTQLRMTKFVLDQTKRQTVWQSSSAVSIRGSGRAVSRTHPQRCESWERAVPSRLDGTRLSDILLGLGTHVPSLRLGVDDRATLLYTDCARGSGTSLLRFSL